METTTPRLSLVEPPILGYSYYTLEFILHVYASAKGLAAVLLQYQENKLKVNGYGSPTLTSAENKYHSSKLEFLEFKWAVCNDFRNYLYYAPLSKYKRIITQNPSISNKIYGQFA